ncbi:MAG: hypothetical protein KDJ52_09630 [Anaerolineae bacterium]|nr:hypothetical protein [Anaerolineae bacterium]
MDVVGQGGMATVYKAYQPSRPYRRRLTTPVMIITWPPTIFRSRTRRKRTYLRSLLLFSLPRLRLWPAIPSRQTVSVGLGWGQ